MKIDIAVFVSKCATYKLVKVDHHKPAGLIQPLEVPDIDMGEHLHGLYHGVTYVTEGSRLHMGNCGQVDQSFSFSARKDRLHYGTVCPDLSLQDIVRLHGVPSKYHV